MATSYVSLSADQENKTCVYLDTEGNALITGNKITLYAEKNLTVGEPAEEGGQPAKQLVLEAEEPYTPGRRGQFPD